MVLPGDARRGIILYQISLVPNRSHFSVNGEQSMQWLADAFEKNGKGLFGGSILEYDERT
ncbi:hypothetical protein J25TS5_37920 [Paenibacillus faecis]|nr:hypothetical protein J25TS5_37920 [Paenibacillus faecis]